MCLSLLFMRLALRATIVFKIVNGETE